MAKVPEWARRSRSAWRYNGGVRPPFAIAPGPGQESVWDYPRPPRVGRDPREIVISAGDTEIARSSRSLRVLETASPPVFYLPAEDVRMSLLAAAPGASQCEWKGEASYWSLALPGAGREPVAWSYPDPFPGFEAIRDCLAFYPGRVDASVGGVRAQPQPGRFYGGWITLELVGPFKGEPGSESW